MPELHDSMVRPDQAEATRKLLNAWPVPVREALVMRPGDHLIVRVEDYLTFEDAAEIRALMKERMPLLADVTVVRAAGLAVFRNEAEAADG